MIGGVTRHMLPHLPGVPHLHVNRLLHVTRCLKEMSYVFSFTFFFFTVAHFHLALVAASISHFATAATNFSCYPSKKSFLCFFIPLCRSLSPFFPCSEGDKYCKKIWHNSSQVTESVQLGVFSNMYYSRTFQAGKHSLFLSPLNLRKVED